MTLGSLVGKPAVFPLFWGRNRKNSLFPPNSPLHRARGDRTPRSPVIAGNAPAFRSCEFRLTAKQALFSVGWPRHAMKRLPRRGGWLCGQSRANLSPPNFPIVTVNGQGILRELTRQRSKEREGHRRPHGRTADGSLLYGSPFASFGAASVRFCVLRIHRARRRGG